MTIAKISLHRILKHNLSKQCILFNEKKYHLFQHNSDLSSSLLYEIHFYSILEKILPISIPSYFQWHSILGILKVD